MNLDIEYILVSDRIYARAKSDKNVLHVTEGHKTMLGAMFAMYLFLYIDLGIPTR